MTHTKGKERSFADGYVVNTSNYCHCDHFCHFVCLYAKIAKMTSERKSENDTPISETVEEYATMLNPIVWVYAILLFRIMIFITGVRLAIR